MGADCKEDKGVGPTNGHKDGKRAPATTSDVAVGVRLEQASDTLNWMEYRYSPRSNSMSTWKTW